MTCINNVFPRPVRPYTPTSRGILDKVYEMKIILETVVPTCTCTGEANFDLVRNSVTYLGYKKNGKPALYGSSIKGVMRFYSLILSSPDKVGDLFGLTGLESRVQMEDAVSDEGQYKVYKLGMQWQPRIPCKGVKVYDQRTLSPGKEPIFFEALSPNSRLVSRIIVYNGSLDDLNLLIASLGGTKYGVKIGRGKEKGYGIIKLVEVKIKELLSESQVNESSVIQSALNIIQSRWNYAKPAFFT